MKPLSDNLLVGPNRSRDYTLWAIILLAVALRAVVMVRGGNLFEDPDNYLPLAQSIAAGEGFQLNGRPTAYRPPLYPIMLAPLVSLGSEPAMLLITALHLGLGAGTVWMTALAAKGSGLSPARAGLAALLVACDPVLVWQSRTVMTETPAAFLTALSLAMLCLQGWRGPMLGGAGLGLCALCRPSSLPGALLIAAAAVLVKPGESRARLARGGLLVLGLFLVISPWIIRNQVVFGEPVWMTTHGGYTLALANNPVYYHDILNGPPGRVWTGADQWSWWRSVHAATDGMSEPQSDRFLRQQVWSLVRERPRDFTRAMLDRLGHFWSVIPAASVYAASVRIAVMAWTIPFWILLVLGLFDPGLWGWPRIAAPLAAIGLTIIHLFFWTDLRMRAPIVPALALIAVGAQLPLLWRQSWAAARRTATARN
jgi:4-amino-4-deoxy-L-arabinose transferase-like glycosyltransferase